MYFFKPKKEHKEGLPLYNNCMESHKNTPAFCQRMTAEEAATASRKATEKELKKLNPSKFKRPRSEGDESSSSSDTMSVHILISKYADRYHDACNKIVDMSTNLQRVQERMIKMTDKMKDESDRKEHFQTISEQYEEDMVKIQNENCFLEKRNKKLSESLNTTRCFFVFLCVFLLISGNELFMNNSDWREMYLGLRCYTGLGCEYICFSSQNNTM